MKKYLFVILALILIGCASKKQANCDAYGNKSGTKDALKIEKNEIG
jgi:uncharacterized protein YcfL